MTEFPQPYLEFVRLFNEQHFFEAHEVLEVLWRREKGEARDFYHGLIQIAAAFVHIQKGTPDGARKLFQTALRYLTPYLPLYRSLDLKNFLREVEVTLAAGREFPRIYLQKSE